MPSHKSQGHLLFTQVDDHRCVTSTTRSRNGRRGGERTTQWHFEFLEGQMSPVQCVWRVLHVFALGRHNAFEDPLGSHSPPLRATLLVCLREEAVGGRRRESGGTMSVG